MRTISGPLLTAARKRQTHFCSLVTLTQVGGASLYFTDADADVTFGGHTYSSRHGCNLSQVRTVLGASAESVGIDFLIKPTGVTGASIEAGTWDNADVRVELVDYTNTALGSIIMFAGYVASASYADRAKATLDCQPYSGRGYRIADEVYSSNCRTDFGDARCKVSLADKQVDTTVEATDNLQKFFVADRSDDDRWNAGLAVFTSGDNAGFNVEIADYDANGYVILRGLVPYPPSVGDAVTLYQGCDKTPAMCSGRYDNILNFRGEPFSIAPWIKTAAYKGSTNTSGGGGGGGGISLARLGLIVGNVVIYDGSTYSNDVTKLFGKTYPAKDNAGSFPDTVKGTKDGWTDGALGAINGKYYFVAAESIKLGGTGLYDFFTSYCTSGGNPSYHDDGGNRYYFGSICLLVGGPMRIDVLQQYVDNVGAMSDALR